MNRLDTIDFAMNETLRKHPDFDMTMQLEAYLLKGAGANVFTSSNGAREGIRNIPRNEILVEVLINALKVCSLYDYLIQKKEHSLVQSIPNIDSCLKFREAYKSGTNSYLYVLSNIKLLSDLIKCFSITRYYEREIFQYLSRIHMDSCEKRINKEYTDISQFSNVVVNERTVNRCKEDILSGKQIVNKHNEYALDGELFAVSDPGLSRPNQEDSVLIITHPKNKDFKLMVVADGMGGHQRGDLASQFVITMIMKWFENLPIDLYSKEEELSQLLCNELIAIDKELYESYNSFSGGHPGSTFTGAIVCQDKTIVENIGDSRTYIHKDGELRQVTRDDSYVQTLYERGEIDSKDKMRFHRRSNVIMQGMGLGDGVNPSVKIIPNSDYDTLLLVSDGVTDCLSDEQIKVITEHTPRELLAKSLVNAAKHTDSYLDENGYTYYDVIHGGKDNESAVVYSPGRR